MEKAYEYRIYPNKTQRMLLSKTFGCVRFVYNHFLALRKEAYENDNISLNYYDCANKLTSLKKNYEWLKEVDSTSLQSSLRNLDNAFKKFFKEHSGFPKFKSKKTNRFTYTSKCTNNNIEYLGRHIKLPKIGLLKTRNKLIPQGRILSATVRKEPSGRYYVTLCCQVDETKPFNRTCKSVGIDLGIKDFAILSNGAKIGNPKYLKKSLDKLAKLQQELSRKSKGSSNRIKARIRVARLYEHISNQRKDFLQKLSTELVRKYDVICIENLDVSKMIQDNQYARDIADVSWSEFVRMLKYKTEWYGKELIMVNTYYPSSQKCNYCGHVNHDVKDLSLRKWICPKCNTSHDRDINAAINILNEGIRLSQSKTA